MGCEAVVFGFDWYGRGWVFYHPNPSGLVALQLNGVVVDGVEVCGFTLDVDYSVLNRIEELLSQLKPGVIVGLGLHPGASRPLLEVAAVNVRSDEPGGRELYPGRPLVVQAPVDVFKLVETVRRRGFDVALSNTLGVYLCNALAYTIYYWAQAAGSRSVFVHIPPAGTLRLRLGLEVSSYPWSTQLLRELTVELIRALRAL